MRSVLFVLLFFAASSLPAQDYVSRFGVRQTEEGIRRIEAPVFGSGEYFRTHFAPALPLPDLLPASRLKDFVVHGAIELSLQAYLELVLVNNPDFTIQKLSVETPRNAITRALARFDPTVSTSFRSTRAQTPTSDALQGAATLNQLTQPFGLNFAQTLTTGAQYSVGFTGQKRSTNSEFATINPSINGSLDVAVTQPLIRNFGTRINKLQYLVARTRFRQSQDNLENQLQQLLAAAENAYWAVIEARESLRVAQEGYRLSEALLKRSERELELGAISALDIYQPQQNLENARINVIQAQYRLEQTLDALRRQIGADLDPDYRHMPVVLTEAVLPEGDEEKVEPEQMVEIAYRQRPDLRSALKSILLDDYDYESARNQLRPDLSLSLSYSSAGVGGNLFEFEGGGISGGSTLIRTIPGGLGDALNQIFGFDFPTYGFTLSLRFPLRDRSAVANLADAAVSKKLNSLRAQSVQQNIRLEVLNAVSQIESSKARVALAQKALEFSQKRLDAEQQKYDLGVSTIFFVLDAQNALVAAQSQVVTQAAQYQRNRTNLLRATGQLLETRGVVITESMNVY